MSEAAAIPAPASVKPTSSAYMITFLGALSMACGLVIVLAYFVTMPAIKRNLAQITKDAVFEIIPSANFLTIYEVLPSGDIRKLEGMEGTNPKLFACYDDNRQLVAIACQGSGRGYGGTLVLLYAYLPETECIVGFKVLESSETPGLGDKIGSDKGFLANFTALAAKLTQDKSALEHPIEYVKSGAKTQPWQIDGISGATISSKAVARILNESANAMLPVIVRHLETIKKGDA